MAASAEATGFWARLDGAAGGLIYGAIMVLAILMAMEGRMGAPFETAVILFGSVLAITLAKAFAELLGEALGSGKRMTRGALRSAWRHSYPTLAATNVPTLLFCAAAMRWIEPIDAFHMAQIFSIALLSLVGARAGWVLDRSTVSSILGAAFAGGIGLAIAVLKFVIH